MRFAYAIPALCALCPMVAAFLAQSPNTFHRSRALGASRYTYSGNLNDDTTTTTTEVTTAGGVGGELVTPQEPVSKYNRKKTNKERFEDIAFVKVQGGSLRTCSFEGTVDRVTVCLKTDGRPLNANVDLWQGPDNAPQKISVYLEDGNERPFCTTIESPGTSNTVAIRNTGQIEFPITAGLEVDMSGYAKGPGTALLSNTASKIVQGGAVFTSSFPGSVKSIQVLLKSDGRPLNACVELLQGPNNNKQVMEIYSEDGAERPLYAIIETPGSGNVVRIVNTATVEFPLTATVAPYITDENFIDDVGEPTGQLTWS